MVMRIDSLRPNDSVVPYEVVAATAGIRPHGPTRRTDQGDRLPIKVNVPTAGVEGQHRQIAATAWTSQVDGPVLMADPQFAAFDYVEVGQYVYEDGTEFHGCYSRKSVGQRIFGFSIRNLCRNGADSETYCPVRRHHSITARDAANAFTSGSCTFL